jgi:hypothetical protein
MFRGIGFLNYEIFWRPGVQASAVNNLTPRDFIDGRLHLSQTTYTKTHMKSLTLRSEVESPDYSENEYRDRSFFVRTQILPFDNENLNGTGHLRK